MNAPAGSVRLAGDELAITDGEFARIQRLLHKAAGVYLAPAKKDLVVTRLGKRLRALSLTRFSDYIELVTSDSGNAERQTMIDQLTTHETYFFREPGHFDFITRHLVKGLNGKAPRIWSAAASTGEEAYSLGMLFADKLPYANWEVVATDISVSSLQTAATGLYPISQARKIPDRYLQLFCRRGSGRWEGKLLVHSRIRDRVHFLPGNLLEPQPALGQFDLIFLRNVMIYFDDKTKLQVLRNVLSQLVPGGYLFIGQSETIRSLLPELGLVPVIPSVYQLSKPARPRRQP